MAHQRGVRTQHAAASSALIGGALMAFASQAAAQEDGGTGRTTSQMPRNYLNLRVGSSSATAESGHPDICAETTPVSFLSLEACGTGSGILHDSGNDLMHLRAKWNVLHWNPGGEPRGLTLEPVVGIGMAELQVASDEPGFRFGDTGSSRAETAGAEGVLQLRLLYPLEHGVELVGAAEFGAAYLPHAGELVTPKPELLPFAGVSLGFGF
ncbi:MAG: hypothetical protein R3B07_01555 [Polyangiaceae bacterium]